jgi:hypothetical protein
MNTILYTKYLILIFISILICYSTNISAQMYVAPDGDDENPGTFEQPFRSLAKAVSLAGPDSLIYMRGGVYYDSLSTRLNRTGQSGRPIKVWAYPGEVPIIDYTNQTVHDTSRGIRVSHNYWHLKGLVVRKAGDNGIYVSGWYNVIEDCIIYECHDTGLQLGGNASYNKIINCDSFLNYDPQGNGEDADGFAAKTLVGPGNEFIGCRAWGNSDDGWDLWEAQNAVLIDSCWAFQNGYNILGNPNFQGDGNGFKLGGNFIQGPHKIIRSVAFDNRGKGFDQNNNMAGITVYNNTAWRNQGRNFSFPSTPSSGVHELKNNISYQGPNLIAANSIMETNSWQGFTVTDADFLSLDTSLANASRKVDNSLPDTDLFRLTQNSTLIDAGVPVGLPFNDAAPDLGAFETDGVPSSAYEFDIALKDFYIKQNFPNPFNSSTKFIYEVHTPGKIVLEIFNALGKKLSEVVNDFHSTGRYELQWTANDDAGNTLPSGIYLAKLKNDKAFRLIKISLIK